MELFSNLSYGCLLYTSRALERLFRNSDYLGSINDGFLYVLLANTSPKDAGYVTQRIAEADVYKRQAVTLQFTMYPTEIMRG